MGAVKEEERGGGGGVLWQASAASGKLIVGHEVIQRKVHIPMGHGLYLGHHQATNMLALQSTAWDPEGVPVPWTLKLSRGTGQSAGKPGVNSQTAHKYMQCDTCNR